MSLSSSGKSRNTDFADISQTWPAWKGCAGIEAYSWTKGSFFRRAAVGASVLTGAIGEGSTSWRWSKIQHGCKASMDSINVPCSAISDSADVVIFVTGHETRVSSCKTCKTSLEKDFAFLSTWWEDQYQNSNGHFGYQFDVGENGGFVGIHTWSRFLLQFLGTDVNSDGATIHHIWRDIIPFTYWNKESNSMRICLVRTEETVTQRLLDSILSTLQSGLPGDPLWPYAKIHEEVIRCQHTATFAVRDMIIYEQERRDDTTRLRPQVDYPRLHEVAKHATTVSEILEVDVRTLESILACHASFSIEASLDNPTRMARQLLHQRFQFQSQIIFGIKCRCISYKDRIKNEIQRAFNLVAQEDAKVSVEIASATQNDGRRMASISIITVIFLPPTFISTIYSTTFFEFGPDKESWSVSDKFYIYWASIVPATFFTAVILYGGLFWRSKYRSAIAFTFNRAFGTATKALRSTSRWLEEA